nr:MAG TPA: hypothetical protein [Caudoviricetes sp.]
MGKNTKSVKEVLVKIGGLPPPTRRSRPSHRHCTFFFAPNHHKKGERFGIKRN